MQVYRSLKEISSTLGRTVVAIGNFDGVHRGHRAIIADVRERAAALGARAVAVTFEPHPMRVLHPASAPKLITPLPERLALLAQTGLDATLVLNFTPEFANTPAKVFAEQVLATALRAVAVHEGDNFRFGRGAEAGTRELTAFGEQMGFAVYGHQMLTLRGRPVSSSEVRQAVASGAMSLARALLGRAFSIRSTQQRDRGVGSRLLVPTINLAEYNELVPAHGVYVTTVSIGEKENARCFEAVTNCGVRPTFGLERFAMESYLLDWNPAQNSEQNPVELTPATPVEVRFLARLRDEQTFPSPEALKAQILRDVASAQRYHRLAKRLKGA